MFMVNYDTNDTPVIRIGAIEKVVQPGTEMLGIGRIGGWFEKRAFCY